MPKNKQLVVFLIALILAISIPGDLGFNLFLQDFPPEPIVGMGNPAAVYCIELGYDYRIDQNDQGEQGFCYFPDQSFCGDWDFLEGSCGQAYSYCGVQGYKTAVKKDGDNGFSQTYAVCLDQNDQVLGSAVELMDLETKSLGCGLLREDIPARETLFVHEAPTLDFALPGSFDWRNYLGGNWLSPIRNQALCGSCWAFSAVAVAEAAHNISRLDPDFDLNLSEEYLVTDCHNIYGYQNCCGGWKDYALGFIQTTGIPDEACLPYVDGTSGFDGTSCSCNGVCGIGCSYRADGDCSDLRCSDACPDAESRKYSISYYGSVGYDVSDAMLKRYLVEYGPLAVSVGITGSAGGGFGINGYPADVYSCSIPNVINHAVVLVGYDDAGGYWIIRNSWGSWNGDGHYKLAYGQCGVNKYPYYAEVDRPEINLLGSGLTIESGDLVPSLLDQTDFGDVYLGDGGVVNTFTIQNLGRGVLHLTGFPPLVEISGPAAVDFSILADPVTPIPGLGGSTSFEVEFDPSQTGLRVANITIHNNDISEIVYEFTVQGTGSGSFLDLASTHWAFSYIEAITVAALTSGYPDGTYRPEDPVTRAEMAVLLLNGIGVIPPAMDLSHPFGDIEGHWAEVYIEELFDQGITEGYPDETYRPEFQVSRAEMAVLLLNSIGVIPPMMDLSHPFSDIKGHWAEAYIEEMYDQGISVGYPDGAFRPENQVTRAEMAVFLVTTFGIPLH